MLVVGEAFSTPAYDPRGMLPESERNGWFLGLVAGPWPGPWPKRNGDLFVVAPDGWQAGLAWESTGLDLLVVSGPIESRWGVFQIRFPIPVMDIDDLVRNFHMVLPRLKEQHMMAKKLFGRP